MDDAINSEDFILKFPEDVQDELRKDLENIVEENDEIIQDLTGDVEDITNPVGRPKGIPSSSIQKAAASRAATEYQRKLREGLIEKEPWETHGAYSYMSNNRVPKKKRYLLEFVHEEREKWLADLGGLDSLSSLEISMLNEACRLLLFSTMINDYLLSDKDSEIVFKDGEGDFKMHTALSKHYLSFTRTYIQILRELQKIVTEKQPKKKGGNKKDSASLLQKLYKEN